MKPPSYCTTKRCVPRQEPGQRRFRGTQRHVSGTKRTAPGCYVRVNPWSGEFGSLTRVSRRLAVIAHFDYRGGLVPHARRQVESETPTPPTLVPLRRQA